LIAAACLAPGARFAPRAGACRRRGAACPAAQPGPAAPRAAPRGPGRALQDFLGDGVPAPAAARAADAARGFSAGDGFLTGGLVDRFI
jgi:hypothetical protein